MRSRSSLLLMFMLILPAVVTAQISTDPAFPTIDQPVTITFNAENTNLEGFDRVFAHTGVHILDGAQWQNVIGDWGDNDVQPELEQDEEDENIFRLEIENIREFYGLGEDQDVEALAFVFRSADSGTQTEDLFVELLTDEMLVRFDRPSMSRLNPLFAEVGDEYEVEAVAGSPFAPIIEMRLFVDDEEVAVSEEDQITYSLEIENEGRTELRVEAEDEDGNQEEASSFIMVNEPVVEEPRPEGIEDGITYHEEDDSKVTLSMFAPENEFVYVLGDFNDWEIHPDFMMHRDDTGEFDGPHFWLEIDDLNPGEEYGFQYFVDGDVRTGDLYSTKVLDPWNDYYLREDGIYPDLKEYPHDKTVGMVSVLQTGRDDFNWQATDYERPDQEELVIYELVIRDFLDEGTYSNMADTLDYFERLGVNAIELMPVSQFDGNISWGYNPSFHLAVDKAYGPAEDLKRLVDEAHQRGIAVILDVVYNHATNLSPFIQLYGTDADENPFLGPGHAWSVFNHLNHDHPYIQYWMDRANRHWMEKFNVDGYRFDLTKGFTANDLVRDNVDAYNQDRVDNLKRMGDELWAFDDRAYLILEHFQREEELELAPYGLDQGYPGMMFWNNLNNQYSEMTMGYTSNLNDTYYGNLDMDVANAITYMESHDEQWLMLKNLKFGNSSDDSRHDVTDLTTALNRQKAAGAFFLTIPGPRMLWQFGELGYGGKDQECLKPGDGSDGDCEPGDPGRTDPKPVRWEYYEDENRQSLYQTWSWLLKLRNEFEVFSSTDTEVELDVSDRDKIIRLSNEDDMDVVIIGNFDVNPREVEFEFTEAGTTWYDFFRDEEIHLIAGDLTYSVELGAGHFKLFTSEDTGLTPPENAGVPTSVEEELVDGGELPAQTALKSNYPNPFNPDTQIPFQLSESGQVTMKVFDILGREVTALIQNEEYSAGTHQVTFDGSNLSSGTYLIRMEANGKVFTNQMMLIK